MNRDEYRIEVDPERSFARLTLSGLWDSGTVDRYTGDVESALEQAAAGGGPAGGYRILIDLRNHGVQSRDVAAEIQDRLSRGIAQASRIAVLTSPSALHRMQAQRLGSHVSASFFADAGEAEKWLFT